MKKDKSGIYFGIFTLAMLLVDVYLIKHMDTIAVLAVAGIVTVMAAYFFADWLFGLFTKKENEENKEAVSGREEQILEFLAESEKADKAKYLMLKKIQEQQEEQLQSL